MNMLCRSVIIEEPKEIFYSSPPSRALLPTLSLLARSWPEREQGFIELKKNNTTSLHYIHISKDVITAVSRLKLSSFLKMFRVHLSLLNDLCGIEGFFFFSSGREACLIV